MPRPLIPIALSAFVLILAGGTPAAAQDYAMFETQYLEVLPGHAAAFGTALAEHNRRFHSEGPFRATVSGVVTGPRSGQIRWAMGPGTFTQFDGRPTGEAHDGHWRDEVLAHARSHTTEYWRVDPDLSSTPDGWEAGPRPLTRFRYFEVADNALFMKTQRQIEDAVAAAGSDRPRTFLRRQFAHRDARDWVLMVPYDRWAELDEEGFNFREAFERVHGAPAWAQFQEERDQAVVSVEDEWRRALPELGGGTTDGR